MKVFPGCSESLGVRSLAVFVETTDVKIFIDPGAALGMRYGLEPSDEEWNMLSHFKERIREIANICDIITISHYHYDHYDPDENFYEGKKVFAKDIKSNINKSQQVRGTEFKKIFEDKFKNMGELIYCDNQNYEFGNTLIKFSSPFPHGEPGTKLGFVLMTTIEEKSEGGNFKILHTSDAGGAVDEESRDYIISGQPNLIIMDGIASYLAGYRIKRENLEISGKNLNEILEKTNAEIIIDHHLLRDLKYKTYFPDVYSTYSNRIKSFAEYLGTENNLLEARRKELFKGKAQNTKNIRSAL